MMSRAKPIVFILSLPFLLSSICAAQVTIGDPLTASRVKHASAGAALYSDLMDPGPANALGCSLPKDAKGTVVAKKSGYSLVAYNPTAWNNSNCRKKSGVGNQPMAWVADESLRSVRNLDNDGYGDTCKAYSFVEEELAKRAAGSLTQVKAGTCESGSCYLDSMVKLVKDGKALKLSLSTEPCLQEDGPQRDGPLCSFQALYDEATNCGATSSGKVIPCSKKECEKRLGKMACENSPWNGKSLRDRFYAVLSLGQQPAKRFGIDVRAMPCIAGVETGYLEPMAKNLMACESPTKHSYHGLGMITLTTLDHYLSPNISNTVYSREDKKIEIGPFRTEIPEFNKPSYYACPKKMHDALGASVELQLEIMAYTIANKLSANGGNMGRSNDEYNAYMDYNANAAIDQENLRPHAKNYADAVLACVRCLRNRMPGSIVRQATVNKDPVNCLSATTRRESVHPFSLATDNKIEQVFSGSMKRYCGEGS